MASKNRKEKITTSNDTTTLSPKLHTPDHQVFLSSALRLLLERSNP